MKKEKVIFGILLFLVTISIGYALLSGNINISSTANVNPIDMDLSLEYGVVPHGDPAFSVQTTETGHSNETISCSGMNCTYSVEFDRPGAIQDFYIQITNNSSFAVRLKRIVVNSSYIGTNSNQTDGLFVVYSTSKDNLGGNNLNKYGLGGGTFTPKTPNLEITDEKLCEGQRECYMRSNGGVYTIGIAEMPYNEVDSNTMNYGVTRTMSFEFEQYNLY